VQTHPVRSTVPIFWVHALPVRSTVENLDLLNLASGQGRGPKSPLRQPVKNAKTPYIGVFALFLRQYM
jgi:hypothetical protein